MHRLLNLKYFPASVTMVKISRNICPTNNKSQTKLPNGRCCLSKVCPRNNVQCTYLAVSRLNAAPREAVYRS